MRNGSKLGSSVVDNWWGRLTNFSNELLCHKSKSDPGSRARRPLRAGLINFAQFIVVTARIKTVGQTALVICTTTRYQGVPREGVTMGKSAQ